MFPQLRSFLQSLRNRPQQDHDIDDEIRFHIEARTEDLIRKGLSRQQAQRQARLEFGALDKSKEACRESRRVNWLEDLVQDARFALRMLRKSPAFTAVAILTLALGIGANTAIFSLIDTVMLKLLPVQRPEELVQVSMRTPNFSNGQRTTYTNPLWEQLRDHQDVFSGLFAWGEMPIHLGQGVDAQNIQGILASGEYFTTLGVQPALGRLFTVNDDSRGCPAVAVLSYGFWQEHFGGASTVIGSTMPLEGHPFQVVGVSAPGFFGTVTGSRFDIAAPICSDAIM